MPLPGFVWLEDMQEPRRGSDVLNDGFRLRALGFEWINGARARGGFLIARAQGDWSLGAQDKSSCEEFQMMINESHTFPANDPTHVLP